LAGFAKFKSITVDGTSFITKDKSVNGLKNKKLRNQIKLVSFGVRTSLNWFLEASTFKSMLTIE
jgi:hypothetical protein